MKQWIVPNWDRTHQIRRRTSEEEDESNRSSHDHFLQKNLSYSNHHVPMPKYEATAVTWPNEELLQPSSTKDSWDVIQTDDTLESIVRQATTSDKQNSNQQGQTLAGKYVQSSSHEPMAMAATLLRKRTRSNPECYEENSTNDMHDENENGDYSSCGGGRAPICRDMDTTLMTWPSLESPRSFKTNNTDQDLAPPGASEDEHHNKRKTDGCSSTKRTRAAMTHNQSERRRRDRINQRLKDLQKLVPNGSKTDRASLLDDTIRYLKQLQAQVQLMGSIRNMPQLIMTALGMQQQQLQMLLLARMGMGVGLLDSDSMACSTMQSIARLLHPTSAATSHAFAPPPVLVPSLMPTTQAKAKLSTSASVPLANPFGTFLEQQSMNMDLYSKMVTLYCQEVNRTPQQTGKSSQSGRAEGGNGLASPKKLRDLVEPNKSKKFYNS